MPVVLVEPEQRWACPNCPSTDVTHEARPHARFHRCRGLRGLTAPFVADGTRCKVEAREREDYEGDSRAQRDGEGRAIMSVVTTRDDGNDAAMLAPCATMRLSPAEFALLSQALFRKDRRAGR